MVQLREDKKRDILEALERSSSEEKLLPLEVKKLKERFADDVFDKDSVEEIIAELEEEGLVMKKTAKMEVVYPTRHEESMEQRFSHLFTASDTFGYYVIGSILSAILLDWKPFFDFVYESGLEPQQMISRYALFGIIGTYVVGKVAVEGYNKAQEKIELLQRYRYLIYPTLVIAAASGSIIWYFSTKTGQPVTTTHIVGIITVSVGAGVPIGELILKNRKEFDQLA